MRRGRRERAVLESVGRKLDERIFELFGHRGRQQYAEKILSVHPSLISRIILHPEQVTRGIIEKLAEKDHEAFGEYLARFDAAKAQDTADHVNAITKGRPVPDHEKQEIKEGLSKIVNILQEIIDNID